MAVWKLLIKIASTKRQIMVTLSIFTYFIFVSFSNCELFVAKPKNKVNVDEKSQVSARSTIECLLKCKTKSLQSLFTDERECFCLDAQGVEQNKTINNGTIFNEIHIPDKVLLCRVPVY